MTRSTHVYLTVASICPHLDDPGNGSVSVEGHIATYSCQENFTLIGLDGNQRACVEGEWIGEDPECKRGSLQQAARHVCRGVFCLHLQMEAGRTGLHGLTALKLVKAALGQGSVLVQIPLQSQAEETVPEMRRNWKYVKRQNARVWKTDRWTYGQTNRQINGLTDGQTYKQTNGRTDRQTETDFSPLLSSVAPTALLPVLVFVECKAIQKNLTVGLITISLGDTGDFIQFSCPATYRLVGNNTQPCNKDTELGAVTASCIRGKCNVKTHDRGSVSNV